MTPRREGATAYPSGGTLTAEESESPECASERLKSLLPAVESYPKGVPQESGWWNELAESEGVIAILAEVSTHGEVQRAQVRTNLMSN